MKAKKFLKDESTLNLSEIAKLMWPNNSAAKVYLSKKLNDSLAWTDADEKKARDVLKELRIRIEGLE